MWLSSPCGDRVGWRPEPESWRAQRAGSTEPTATEGEWAAGGGGGGWCPSGGNQTLPFYPWLLTIPFSLRDETSGLGHLWIWLAFFFMKATLKPMATRWRAIKPRGQPVTLLPWIMPITTRNYWDIMLSKKWCLGIFHVVVCMRFQSWTKWILQSMQCGQS